MTLGNYNLNMFGMNGMYSYNSYYNPFSSMIMGGFGNCGSIFNMLGCCTPMSLNAMAGWAVGATVLGIGAKLADGAITAHKTAKQENSIESYNSKIDEQLDILGVENESEVADAKPEAKYDDAITTARNKIAQANEIINNSTTGLEATRNNIAKIDSDINAYQATIDNGNSTEVQIAEALRAKAELIETKKKYEAQKEDLENLQKKVEAGGEYQKELEKATAAKAKRQREIDNAKAEANKLIKERNEIENNETLNKADGTLLERRLLNKTKNYSLENNTVTKNADLTERDYRSLIYDYRTGSDNEKKAIKEFVKKVDLDDIRNKSIKEGLKIILES